MSSFSQLPPLTSSWSFVHLPGTPYNFYMIHRSHTVSSCDAPAPLLEPYSVSRDSDISQFSTTRQQHRHCLLSNTLLSFLRTFAFYTSRHHTTFLYNSRLASPISYLTPHELSYSTRYLMPMDQVKEPFEAQALTRVTKAEVLLMSKPLIFWQYTCTMTWHEFIIIANALPRNSAHYLQHSAEHCVGLSCYVQNATFLSATSSGTPPRFGSSRFTFTIFISNLSCLPTTMITSFLLFI